MRWVVPSWSLATGLIWLLAWTWLAALACGPAYADEAAALEFFERDVRPVLIEKCWKCHGPEKQWSGLRLDSRAAIERGGEGGVIVVAGEPARSRLIAAIRHDGDLQMPPEEKLTDRQIAAITKWVELGVPWPKETAPTARPSAAEHWAFQPVRRPPVPAVRDAEWPLTPVDSFILARLEQAGFAPSPVADRRTLIRRVTMDLTGLPPTPTDVAAFIHDPDPLAYERLVDRLLASPQLGEQWGRHWLDVARYSDTKGYVYGREERFWVHAWSYRDWVVRALNDDLPYDRFLLLQLAADQVAPDDVPAQAAMGFLTLGRRFLGVTHDVIDDRIDVVTRGTMGLTVGCARCHDHKYDPIPTRDYYSLYGVFLNCTERRVTLGDEAAVPPAVRDGLAERQTKLRDTLATRRAETATRIRARLPEYLLAQLELHKYPEEGFDQILAPEDILPAFVRRWRDFLARGATQQDTIFSAWRAFAAIPGDQFSAQAADVCRSVLSEATVHPQVKALFATPPESMQEVAARYGQLFASVEQEWQAALTAAKEAQQPAPTALADAEAEQLRRILYGPEAPCEVPDEPIVSIENHLSSKDCTELWQLQGEVDRYLIRTAEAPAQAVTLVDRLHPLNARVLKRGNPAQLGDEVPRQLLQVVSTPDRPPFRIGSGRLELAQAIASPQNPLTARVIVNRVWLHHFGAGLVRTPSDFGLRAESPSHPELLDWLTSRFIEEGWSLKWLHRQIVLSAVYRQASEMRSAERGVRSGEVNTTAINSSHSAPPTPHSALGVDPENRLFWRMNARRLTWEELRDSLLAASDELQTPLGGRPVDLFAKSGPFRRTLYGLVDRQFLPSALRVFDFANPDLHIPVRSETTVPQQALFLLNHPLVLDRAEALAAASHAEVSRSLPSDRDTGALPTTDRIQWLFQRVLQRDPTLTETEAALHLLSSAEGESTARPAKPSAWQYGFGKFDDAAQRVQGFTPLPYFNGRAWQGGESWPDAKLGWVQLTAEGGHAGNDRDHAAVRRWVAPRAMTVQVRSTLVHDKAPGDGIRGFLVSNRHGLHHTASLHNTSADFHAEGVALEAGDTLDFAVDIGNELNNDDFTWDVTITEVGNPSTNWNSRTEFAGTPTRQLSAWAQLAQVLFLANEFCYVD